MISFLLFSSSFLNIFAIGIVIALILEQIIKARPLSVDASLNEKNNFILQTNRKYLWRQSWVININWFVCNLGLYFVARNITPVDNFWSQGL